MLGLTLVTGATGFIGRHLVSRLLGEGVGVRVLVRGDAGPGLWKDVEIVKGDVRNLRAMLKAVAGVETVFHLAGKAHDLEELHDTGEHAEVTLTGTQNVMAAATESGAERFIFMSSLSVYGTGSQAIRDESTPCHPVSAYGRAKFHAEQNVLDNGTRFGMHVCCLRPAMVYGPGCKGNLPRMIRMIDLGIFPPLPELENRRSMVFVSNVLDATMLAATSQAANGQCYNVTDARPYSTRDLHEMICRGLGKRVPRWHIPVGLFKALARVGDTIDLVLGRRFPFDSDALEKLIGSAWFSSAKIARELGFHPSITFEDALPELIDWYRNARSRALGALASSGV